MLGWCPDAELLCKATEGPRAKARLPSWEPELHPGGLGIAPTVQGAEGRGSAGAGPLGVPGVNRCPVTAGV